MNTFSSLLMSLGLISTAATAATAAAPPWSVTFVIDMKARIAAKTFDPAKDAVGVRGGFAPLIVVGISDTEARRDEYTPTRDERGGGKADLYDRLIVEELKPFIDRTYRTRPAASATGIGGASLGGLVSLYLGLKYPDVFGTIFAVSPHVWWDHGVILKQVAALPKKTAQRIWVDVGTGEGEEYVDGVRQLRAALIAKGWKIGKELACTEDDGAQHDELAWAARVEPMLRWALAPSPERKP